MMAQVEPTIWLNPDHVSVVRENLNQYMPEAKTEIILEEGRFIYSVWPVNQVLDHLSGAVR